MKCNDISKKTYHLFLISLGLKTKEYNRLFFSRFRMINDCGIVLYRFYSVSHCLNPLKFMTSMHDINQKIEIYSFSRRFR